MQERPTMNNLVRQIQFLAFLFLFAIAGCAGPEIFIGPAVTGVIYWINGEAHQYYENDAETLYRATKRAMVKLGLKITKDNLKNNTHYLQAGDRNRFSVTIQNVDKKVGRINIRINFMGDKDYAELIYKKIDEELDNIQYDEQGKPSEFPWLNRKTSERVSHR